MRPAVFIDEEANLDASTHRRQGPALRETLRRQSTALGRPSSAPKPEACSTHPPTVALRPQVAQFRSGSDERLYHWTPAALYHTWDGALGQPVIRHAHGENEMDLQDLRLFTAVVRSGSLSRAGREAHCSQPTVSRRIQGLESELGMPLLVRGSRTLSPTPAGLEFLHFAETALGAEAELRAKICRPWLLRGDLQVAASTTPGEGFVPGLLAAFTQGQPDLRSQLHIMDSRAVEECVLLGHCDAGFTGHPPAPGLLRSEAVGEDELVLVVGPGHPWHDRREMPLEVLCRQNFVERGAGSGTRRTVEEALSQVAPAFSERPIVLTVSSAQALLASVRTGVGCGFVSRASLQGATTDGLHPLHIAGVPLKRQIFLVLPQQPTAKALAFAAFVRLQTSVRENLGAPPAVR